MVWGELRRYAGCPVAHVPDDVGMWLTWYSWRTRWNASPVSERILTIERLDPRYYDVMDLIDATLGKKKPNGE